MLTSDLRDSQKLQSQKIQTQVVGSVWSTHIKTACMLRMEDTLPCLK